MQWIWFHCIGFPQGYTDHLVGKRPGWCFSKRKGCVW